MSTGACGVDCTVCRLHVQGICSTCGAGTSEAGQRKLAGQKHLFGQGCAVLQCAVDRGVAYCLRDCDEFPCARFAEASLGSGCYPFSQGFLDMQQRRRAEAGSDTQVAWPARAEELWQQLADGEAAVVCARGGASLAEDRGRDGTAARIQVQSLRETWLLDVGARTATKEQGAFGGEWDRQFPFLLLVYLTHVSGRPEARDMVAPRELYSGLDAFQGRHVLHTHELESAFGRDGAGFAAAAQQLGGEPIEGGDVGMRFRPLPKLPVDYLLWLADEEFPARLTLLLDRETSTHLPADACAVLVNLLTGRLLLAGRATSGG